MVRNMFLEQINDERTLLRARYFHLTLRHTYLFELILKRKTYWGAMEANNIAQSVVYEFNIIEQIYYY